MKTKNKSKTKKTKSKTRARPKSQGTPRMTTLAKTAPLNPYTSPDFKTCEEVEVGDIGGFGVTNEERMERETRCAQRATQFCKNCERNLCNTHYELLHKDHDNRVTHTTGPSPVQM